MLSHPMEHPRSLVRTFSKTPGSSLLSLLLAVSLPVIAANDNEAESGRAMEGYVAVAQLHVVDCLLPSQVRRLGRRTYLTPRRPTRTTAADCAIRGGEYVDYDRGDYKTALRVWLPAAESGEAEAQVSVGEIFERGLGDVPNYEAAIIWYEKAAAQGNRRAQFNMGTLYEQGLGVAQDNLIALNWYRQAWGIAEDEVIFTSAAEREREVLRARLEATISEKGQQISVLQARLQELEEKLNLSTESGQDARSEATTLRSLVAQLEVQRAQDTKTYEALPKTREPTQSDSQLDAAAEAPALAASSGDAAEANYRDLSLGAYYALLIGNQNYIDLEDLDTPLSDVSRAKQILEDVYGFTVFTITDGDNIELMRAINDLYEIVGENDNLLLFFAGHGSRLSTGDTELGYWLPANAEQPPRNTYWVANEFVTGHLSRLKAKRVLVVADSCYAGLLSSEPSFLLLGDDGPQYSNMDFLKFKLTKRSRLLLSSGGDRPVLDGGGGNHSIFARAFLDELESNQKLLPSPELFLRVRSRVARASASVDFIQQPEFKTIKSAGHEVGDFFFVPVSLRQ